MFYPENTCGSYKTGLRYLSLAYSNFQGCKVQKMPADWFRCADYLAGLKINAVYACTLLFLNFQHAGSIPAISTNKEKQVLPKYLLFFVYDKKGIECRTERASIRVIVYCERRRRGRQASNEVRRTGDRFPPSPPQSFQKGWHCLKR